MEMIKDIECKLSALKPILYQQYHVEKIGIFGSFARNEQTEASDLDILVSFHKPLGWAFFDLQDFLEKEFNRKIDLVTIPSLKSQLKEDILKEARFV